MESRVFISTAELQTLLESGPVQIIDSGLGHKEAYLQAHIPNAIFFNIPEIKSKTSDLSLDFPSLGEFRQYMIERGVKNNGTPTVVYFQHGMIMAGRAWYLLKHYGLADVRILDGGLSKWVGEGRPVEKGERVHEQGVNENDYNYHEALNCRVMFEEVERLSEGIESGQNNSKIWDLRPPEHFNMGTVKAAVNLPIGMFFNQDMTVKSKDEVREIIRARLGDVPIVATCTKGVLACSGLALLEYCGHQERKVYTGSFEEWSKKKLVS